MVRTYRIHTNLDGNDNEIIDLTDGKIRLYQPSDLGIVTNTNIWSSQGLGVFGDTTISHPGMDFKLETFGDNLQENYKLINEFVSKILAQKYVTLEYTSEMGTYYADVKLAKVSKTEGYGANGTFSETISFDVINKWYAYEALTFSNYSNPDFNEKTKIHAQEKAIKKMKGGNVTVFESKTADEIDAHAKKLGLNSITYPIKVMVQDAQSNSMDFDNESLLNGTEIIKELTKRGYQIIIEPYPYIASGTIAETEWNPTNKSAWFDNWKKIVEKVAEIATEVNGKYYVASNFVKLESESEEWVNLIQYLKGKYTAKLIYRTNWWVTASWAPETVTAYNAKLNNPLFAEVDEIAIAGYFELTDEDVPSVETLKKAIKNVPLFGRGQNIYQEIKAFNTKWNKPIFFGELGIAPFKKAGATPWKYEYSEIYYDEQVQSNWYQAWYETFRNDDWFKGFSVFVIATKNNMFSVTEMGEKTLKTMNSIGAGRYTYTTDAYLYTSEDKIDRFSKWTINEGIFSFVARLTPSDTSETKYGLRFLDENANEYTSIILNMSNKPQSIQINTDVNDEYYQTISDGTAVNMFSALDFQKFRTRIFKKGTMELVNLDTVEMNVKRKVDFV